MTNSRHAPRAETVRARATQSHGLPLPRIRHVVVDSNVLLNDLLRTTRTGQPTYLARLPHWGGLHVYASAHVRHEVHRHLPRFAEERGVDPTEMAVAFGREYASSIRWVDTRSLQFDSDQIRAVLLRDPDDVPSAKLAMLLGSAVLSEDRDLVDTGFGSGPAWLQSVLGVRTLALGELGGLMASELAVRAVSEAARLGWRLGNGRLNYLLAIAGALALLMTQPTPRGVARRNLTVANTRLRDLWDFAADLAAAITESRERASNAFNLLALDSTEATAVQMVARRLAEAPRPMRFDEIASGLPDEDSEQLRAALAHSPFVITDRGWQLGLVHAVSAPR